MRFGLEDGKPKTLEEVGKEFRVTVKGFVRLKLKPFPNLSIQHELEN